MEPFVDFGLFEIAAASGIAIAAKWIYRRRAAAFLVIATSVIAPAVIIFAAPSELIRWLAAACLATSLLNAGFIVPALGRGSRIKAQPAAAVQPAASLE